MRRRGFGFFTTESTESAETDEQGRVRIRRISNASSLCALGVSAVKHLARAAKGGRS